MSFAHLAIDLGASSGRAIVGVLEGDPLKLRLAEVHRFEHWPCPTPTGPVWDLTGIWQQVLTGLGAASTWCQENNVELNSVGVDTWGVDWALIGKSGELLALPHCYRDPQNEAACEKVLTRIGGFDRLYERTGIQRMSLNTLFQVAARYEREPKLFEAAERLLFLPDLFHYWLSGEMATERCIASTSSMLAVDSGDWDFALLEELGLPTHMLGPIVDPATALGTLRHEIAEQTHSSSGVQVIAPASHDTAAAVAAVPAKQETNWAYLSSGTWSLLGAELDRPITSALAQQAPFTNERGVDGTIRFLRNIAGLWLVQELRREINERGEVRSFEDLVQAAQTAEPGRTLVDPNQAEFSAPGNIADKFRRFARRTGQHEPTTIGELVRCALESLALCYAQTLSQLEAILAKPVDVLHIVGGGTKNALLNELTAAAVGRSVVLGPVEATAVGNLLVQAIGCGELAGFAELREVVRNSFPLKSLEADTGHHWNSMRDKFAQIIDKQK